MIDTYRGRPGPQALLGLVGVIALFVVIGVFALWPQGGGPSNGGQASTLAAEVVAGVLGLELYVIDLSTVVDKYVGETEKNLERIFAEAEGVNAVLFFDEADAIAGRRFAAANQGSERESNAVVNVLLRVLEAFPGVVIFATNLATSFDAAFERRIRQHILFAMPDAATSCATSSR